MKLKNILKAGFGIGMMAVISAVTPLASIAREAEEPAQQTWTGDVYRISDEELDDELRFIDSIGGRILFNRDDLYLVIYPVGSSAEAQNLGSAARKAPKTKHPGLKPITPPKRKALPTMETARFAKDANFILEGLGLPGSFDGSGVVVGFTDIGFDACHSNFLNADGSESRVRRFVHYELEEGRVDRLETPEEIAAYRTDRAEQGHATHVAGIMAGRGGGGKYIGMAPGADIVATTSDLYDVVILAGVEEIIAYAKSVGKPAVVNISIGSYGGPHDGTSLFAQYLDKCAEDAIICISTGNEGNTYNHVGHTFTSPTDKVDFRWQDRAYTFFNVWGSTEIYSEDESPIQVGLYAVNCKWSTDVLYKGPMIDLTEEPEWILTSDPELAASDPRYHYDEKYAEHFDGEIYVQGGIDPNNGRFYARITYDTHTDTALSASQPWGKYQFGGYVQGVEGKRVDLWGDGAYSAFIRNVGKPIPDNDMSISDLATGKNVVSVGAYWTSEGTEMFNGGTWWGGTPMTIADFTSYGTLPDGRVTPMTSAPGGPITSSYSGPNVALYGSGACAYEFEGDYWGLNSGTSMSTPYVAGCIATWLQANPQLTSKEVQELILESNDTEGYPFEANPRHGQGVLDPYKGLKILVDRGYTDVETVLSQSVFATWTNGELKVNNPDNRELRVDVYSIDGRLLCSLAPGAPDALSLSARQLCLEAGFGLALVRVSAPGTASQVLKIGVRD